MTRLKTYLFIALSLVCSLLFSGHASAETCKSLYDGGLYEEAIPLCLEEKQYFRLGYIYGQINDCQNMTKYYKLENSGISLGNLGINLYYGTAGCEKNIQGGLGFLKQSVDRGSRGYAKLIGDYYRDLSNFKAAKNYYLISINYGLEMFSSKWSMDRARSSYEALMDLYDRQEKRDFYLEKINRTQPWDTNDWSKELKTAISQGIHSILNTEEKIDFFIEASTAGSELRCEIGSKLISQNFESLFEKLTNEININTFASGLCKGDEEYFIAKSFENGLGKKEDFQEAYRLYLIAGSKGNTSAKAARERIRDMITPEQTQEAVCLADYGIEPSYFDKLLCKF